MKPLRVHPSQTGKKDDLYKLDGFPESLAQQIESDYLRLVDGNAKTALDHLCEEKTIAFSNSRLRGAWTQFILSLMTRMPEDIDAARKAIELSSRKPPDDLRRSIDNIKSIRSKDNPLSAEEILSHLELSDREFALYEAFMASHTGDRGANHFSRLTWRVIDFTDINSTFLTSDRPLVRFQGINQSQSAWAIPISPTQLFAATPDRKPVYESSTQWERRALKMLGGSSQRIVKSINKAITQQAIKFVYATDDSALGYVSRHFGTKRESMRPAEKMLERAMNEAKLQDN